MRRPYLHVELNPRAFRPLVITLHKTEAESQDEEQTRSAVYLLAMFEPNVVLAMLPCPFPVLPKAVSVRVARPLVILRVQHLGFVIGDLLGSKASI